MAQSLNDHNNVSFVPCNFHPDYLSSREANSQNHSVLVAIMDTGVDPGAFGLTSCPDGSKKIIDVIDCTGADDVIVKVVTPADVLQYLPAFETVLKLRPSYDSGSNTPSYTSSSDSSQTSTSESSVSTDTTELTDDGYIQLFSDDECRLYTGHRSFRSFVSKRKCELFSEQHKRVIDDTVFKIVVYEKDDDVLCLVDYDGVNFIILREYHIQQEYGSIPLGDNLFMNFGFHLYNSTDESEKICSLVFDAGSHATHVAGIIGGSFPDPSMNGVNPHCKILSLKIGDTRVDGMETSIALIRALREIVRYDCHIVNYSYGEPVANDKGRFIDMLNEYTYKHNITFVTSAGNSGPTVTTVGAPGVVTDRTINIGAYTNREYLKKLYFLSGNAFEEGAYDWSSRGPSMNGGMGVDVLASGCALTSHPRWNNSNLKMCNGTSMAAPNAAGFLSLVMSQFEKSHYPHTFWLKRYLEATCKPVDNLERFSQGHGLIGQNYVNLDYFDLIRPCNYFYEVVVNDNQSKKGIVSYETESKSDADSSTESSDDSSSDDDTIDTMGLKFAFNTVELRLTSLPGSYGDSFKSNESFHTLMLDCESIGSPQKQIYHIAHPGCKTVRIAIPKNTPVSNYIKVFEIDKQTNAKRYVQSIPVNIFVCAELNRNETLTKHNVNLPPGSIRRYYVIPNSNILKVKMMSSVRSRVTVEVTQMYSGVGYDKRHSQRAFLKNPPQSSTSNEQSFLVNVVPGSPAEICVYTGWSAAHTENVSFSVSAMHNDVSLPKHLYEMSEEVQLNINRYLEQTEKEYFKTSLKLNRVVTKYHPQKAEIHDVDSRYSDKDGKQLKLLRLHYKVNSHPKTSYYINTSDRVYDSRVCMSGCIHGFYHNRRIFFANYVPKTSDKALDEIVIEMMDSDENVLKECVNTVLSATRPPSKSIETTLTLKRGLNVLEPSLKDLLKLEDVYNGDYLQFGVLDEMFLVMYRKPLTVKLTNSKKRDAPEQDTDKSSYNQAVKKHMTNFDNVNRFIDRLITQNTKRPRFDTTDDRMIEVVENSLTYVDPDCVNTTNALNATRRFMNETIEERNQHEYIGTMFLEESPNDADDDTSTSKLAKRIRLTHEHLSHQKLLKTPPYMVIDLANSIVEKPRDVDDVENKLKIISTIETEMNFWNNCAPKDLDQLRKRVVEYAEPRSGPGYSEQTKKLTNLKRKCDLMLNADEEVF